MSVTNLNHRRNLHAMRTSELDEMLQFGPYRARCWTRRPGEHSGELGDGIQIEIILEFDLWDPELHAHQSHCEWKWRQRFLFPGDRTIQQEMRDPGLRARIEAGARAAYAKVGVKDDLIIQAFESQEAP